jgi:predicted permease
MIGLRAPIARMLAMFSRRPAALVLDEEIRHHLDLLTAQYVNNGLPQLEAETMARRAFGGVSQVQDAYFDEHGFAWVDQLVQDVRLALRKVAREPRLLCATTLTIGLGVGANAAVLDTAQQLLFRPLAVPSPSQVVALYHVNRKTGQYLSTSYPDYADFRDELSSLQALAAYMRLPVTWTESNRLERVTAEAVTPNFFTMLQLRPVLGSTFASDRQAQGWPLVALIAESFWRSHFGANPAAVGRTMRLDGQVFTVIGVAPGSFETQNVGWTGQPMIWIPMDAVGIVQPSFRANDLIGNRNARFALMLGRLRDGVTLREAQAQVDLVATKLAVEFPDTNDQVGATMFPAGRVKFFPAYLETVTRSVAAFVAASSLIFVLSACNLITLLSQRMAAGDRELAVRLSLGGSTARVARQLLLEGVLLAFPGFWLALALAWALQQGINRFPKIFGTGLALDLKISSPLVLGVLACSFLMALIFALLPVARLRRVKLADRLQDDRRTMSGRQRGWLRGVPAAAQVVVSAVLLAGALLVLRSVLRGETAYLGFDRSHVLSVSLEAMPGVRFTDGREAALQVARELGERPGIESVSITSIPPLDGMHQPIAVGNGTEWEATLSADQVYVDTEFFQTMGIQVVRGRNFVSSDRESEDPVAVVSESLTRLWPARIAEGQQLIVTQGRSTRKALRVIGVARDVKYRNLWNGDRPMVYRVDWVRSAFVPAVILRTFVDANQIAPDIRRSDHVLPTGLFMTSVKSGDDLVQAAVAPARTAGWFLGSLATLALLVAAIGLHSTLVYAVTTRKREMAIRIAVGGAPTTVALNVLRPTAILALTAVAVGLAASWVFTPLLAVQSPGVSAHDGMTLLAVAITLLLACCAVTAVSLAQAAQTSPTEALRAN